MGSSLGSRRIKESLSCSAEENETSFFFHSREGGEIKEREAGNNGKRQEGAQVALCGQGAL